MSQTNSGCEDNWKSILTKWDLSEFESKFKENGFTDMQDWIHIDDNDMTQMGFKKGHKLRFVRKLKQFVVSLKNKDSFAIGFEGKHDDNLAASYSHINDEKLQYYDTVVNKPELLGGDSWIELGEFRMGQVDASHFSISHKTNKKTCMIFRKDGTIHPGPRTDYGLFDRKYIKGLANVLIGDGWIQLGDWRVGVCDNNRDHLSISHKSTNTCMIWRSDGTRHKGPRKDWNNYWKRNNMNKNSVYGTYYVLDKDDHDNNKYIKWIQFGDNWRIGDIDTDHFSISANKAFFKYDNYCTAVIYRRDGTIHPGRRNDYGLWVDKRKCKALSLLN